MQIDYAQASDEQVQHIKYNILKAKGFFILPSQLFENVVKNKEDDENLKEEQTKKYMKICLENGEIKTIGTEINEILPPSSRIIQGYDNKINIKERVIKKFNLYLDKFFRV